MVKKAFTLAEIFIATVILSVLVSLCLTFFTTKKDYEREYMYYSAYQNLVKVVDSALLNEQYLRNSSTQYVEETECGTTSAPYKCRAFKGTSGVLCKVLSEYFNTTGTVKCTSNANYADLTKVPSLKLTNGMDIFFENLGVQNLALFSDTTMKGTEVTTFSVRIDINGRGNGEDKSNYDYMTFYVTRSGKVIPGYGTVTGLRGYEYTPAAMDAGGNPLLMAFDVVYTEDDSNALKVLDDARSVSFREAACKSGYIGANTAYCTATPAVAKATTCNDVSADCRIRLVKKLKRTK